MRVRKALLLGTASLLTALWALPSAAANFTTQRFWVAAQINKDRSVDFTETIQVNFTIPQHGLHRIIPIQTKGSNEARYVHLVVDAVQASDDGVNFRDVDHKESGDADLDIRIGSSGVTISGPQTYVIHYHVKGAIRDFPNGDAPNGAHSELYWNMIPAHWATSMDAAGFTVNFPAGGGTSYARVYVGPPGSTNATDLNSDGKNGGSGSFVGKMTADSLQGVIDGGVPLETGSTAVLAMPIGTLDPPPPGTDYGAYMKPLAPGSKEPLLSDRVSQEVGLGFAMGLPLLLLIFRSSRMRWPFGKAPVAFESPPELEVMDAAYLLHPTFKGKDFVAGIVSAAQKKYCRLHETPGGGFGIELIPGQFGVGGSDSLLPFTLAGYGGYVAPAMLTSSFAPKFQAVRKSIGSDLKKRKYLYTTSTASAGCAAMFLGLWGTVFGMQAIGRAAGIGWGIGCFLFAIISAFITNLTPAGERSLRQLKGLKTFVSSPTETRNLQHFAATDFTESLYEKLLPYAILFGTVREWNAAFAGVTLEQPDWYVGSGGYWVDGMYTNYDYTDTMMATSFTPTSSYGSGGGFSSGDSGFSGGGSDSGGGGGGGDSW